MAQRFSACVVRTDTDSLAPGSPFSSIEERECLLKYAPFGLSVSTSGKLVRVAEVIRDETLWREEPLRVEAAEWNYPRMSGLKDISLVRATRVASIDYVWRIGRTERIRSAR